MIDEKKLIEELQNHLLEYKKDDVAIGINVVREVINNQPKTREWIPCSERMPKKNQQVIYCDECGLVGFALYRGENLFFDNCAEFDDVIAWQPLPEPYKEDKENEN